MAERKDTRVTVGVGVILTIDGKAAPCMTRNLSRGGMFVVTRREAREGSIVGLEVVHGKTRLRARARVVKRTEEGLGLSFVEVDDNFREAVRNLMKELVAVPSGVSVDDFDDVEEEPLVLSWAMPGEESSWKFWKKRKHTSGTTDLNLDGAGLVSDARPDVGLVIVVYIEGRTDKHGQPLACDAEVVRHTDKGFAIRFVSPSIDFRRVVSQSRRSKFMRG